MTNKELEKKIEELSAQIEALKSELKETPKDGIWRIWQPKYHEYFWYIDEWGEVYSSMDKDYVEIGNCYPTKEKAEFEAQREKYTRLFRQYVEQHSEPLDWKNDLQSKWFVNYDHECNNIEYLCNHSLQSVLIYGSSEEVMQDAVAFIGEENVLRYILSVEENDGD